MVIYSTKQIVTSVYNKGCKPRISLIYTLYRGEIGIRTLGTVARTPHFECGPIGHSGISPNRRAKITIPFDS